MTKEKISFYPLLCSVYLLELYYYFLSFHPNLISCKSRCMNHPFMSSIDEHFRMKGLLWIPNAHRTDCNEVGYIPNYYEYSKLFQILVEHFSWEISHCNCKLCWNVIQMQCIVQFIISKCRKSGNILETTLNKIRLVNKNNIINQIDALELPRS